MILKAEVKRDNDEDDFCKEYVQDKVHEAHHRLNQFSEGLHDLAACTVGINVAVAVLSKVLSAARSLLPCDSFHRSAS